MNPFLIATQGISGGAMAMAVNGFSLVDDVPVVPYVPSVGSVQRYYSHHREEFDIPVKDDDEEEVVMAIMLEVGKYVC